MRLTTIERAIKLLRESQDEKSATVLKQIELDMYGGTELWPPIQDKYKVVPRD